MLSFNVLLLTWCQLALTNGGVLTDSDALYTHLFTNYSSKTRPVLNHTHNVDISIAAYISNINKFDEMSGELSATLSFAFSWTEERISWDPTLFGGISSLSVSPADIWRPSLYLLEATDRVVDINNNSMPVRIFSDGSIFWISGNVFRISCSVNVVFFPFDEQTCEMTLLNWDVLSMGTGGTSITANVSDVDQFYFKTNSQWDLKSGKLQNCIDVQGGCVNVLLLLKRRSNFFVIYILVPLVFLGLINIHVFAMPASCGERTTVAITTFLSFVVYMGIVNDIVPQSSDPVAYIYYYIIAMMIYSCLIMFLSIMSLNIHGCQRDIPKWLNVTIWYLRLQFFKTTKNTIPDRAMKRRDTNLYLEDVVDNGDGWNNSGGVKREISVIHDSSMSDTAADGVDEYKVTWYLVGETFDDYCFILLLLIFIAFTASTFIHLAKNQDV